MLRPRRFGPTLVLILLASLVACRPTPAERIDRANVALASRKVDEAVAELEKGLAEAPDLARLHERHAFALTRKGDPVRAEAAYRRALELDPRLGAAHLGLADLLWALGRRDEARGSYRRFLESPITDDQLLALERARVTTLLATETRADQTRDLGSLASE